MTRVIEIAGIRPEVSKNELSDRAKNVKPTAFVDTANLSEGEMTVFLLAQRAKIRSEFYPEYRQYRDEYERARDVLYKGLHTLGVDYLGQRLKSQPASGWLTWSEKERNPSAGIKLLFDDAPVSGIGAIPQLDCNALYPIIPFHQWKVQNGNNPDAYEQYVTLQEAKLTACETENLWRDGLNQFWGDTGSVLVYEFLTASEVPSNLPNSSSQKLYGKQARHVDFVGAVKSASKISRTNLRLWMENGLIYNTSTVAVNGNVLGPATPQQFIGLLRDGGHEGIGFAPLVIAIPIAIGVTILNYAGFKKLINVIKGKQSLSSAIKAHVGDIQAFFEKYAQQILVLANTSDFALDGQGNNQGGQNCPPGFYYDTDTQSCKPIKGDGNFWDNLTQTEKIGLGIAVVGGALLLNRK